MFVGGKLNDPSERREREALGEVDWAQLRALRASYKKVGLITLQATVPPNVELLAMLGEECPEWAFILRPHRKHWHLGDSLNLDLGALLESGQFVLAATPSAPLLALMPECDGHLTGFSTCARDALEVGLPTVLTHEWGNEFFEYEIEQGVVLPYDGMGNVAEAVRRTEQIAQERCLEVFRSLVPGEAEVERATGKLLDFAKDESVAA